MDTGFQGLALRTLGLVGDVAVRMTLVVAAAALLITIAAVQIDSLPPVLGLLLVVGLLWRPAQLLARRLESAAAPEQAQLLRQVDLLGRQVEQLQREQRQLQAVVRWQEQLLEDLVHEQSPRTRRRAS